MTTKPNPVPSNLHTVTPYLNFESAPKAIDFYKKAFGAIEQMRMEQEGKVMHAQIKIGDSTIMLSDMFCAEAKESGPSTASFYLYTEDVDKFVDKAVKAGADLKRPVETQFYGDRTGQLEDPFGNTWTVASHVEDVSSEEMKKRAQKMFAEMAKA